MMIAIVTDIFLLQCFEALVHVTLKGKHHQQQQVEEEEEEEEEVFQGLLHTSTLRNDIFVLKCGLGCAQPNILECSKM